MNNFKIEFKEWFLGRHCVRKFLCEIRNYVWFGWWWASICSAHWINQVDCERCQAGCWVFGRKHTIGIDPAYMGKWYKIVKVKGRRQSDHD